MARRRRKTPRSSAPPRPTVARSTRPANGERHPQGGHPGPGDDGSRIRGGGSRLHRRGALGEEADGTAGRRDDAEGDQAGGEQQVNLRS